MRLPITTFFVLALFFCASSAAYSQDDTTDKPRKENPNNLDARAAMLTQSGNFREAADAYTKLIELYPKDPSLYVDLSRCRLELLPGLRLGSRISRVRRTPSRGRASLRCHSRRGAQQPRWLRHPGTPTTRISSRSLSSPLLAALRRALLRDLRQHAKSLSSPKRAPVVFPF